MKALSIKQPWASLIAHGIKDIENRTWKTKFRGRIYIHASGKFAGDPKKLLNNEQWDEWHSKVFMGRMEVSAIIGEVDIIDCVINHPSVWAEKAPDDEPERFMFYAPIYNWVLANAKLYNKPILNVKGKLSFWETDIDIVECVGCSDKFDAEFMQEDDGGEKFCGDCWEVLSPIMLQEAKENK